MNVSKVEFSSFMARKRYYILDDNSSTHLDAVPTG